ncbi:hypothetical protein R70723_11775 [Paenibacillus sp. FSL R7-0273]|uniref:hypothetical protein n=1 Tax=Paenibacillus sp. FSL R7-0273 TaxID=1536772 RepID=UPI0004F5CB63|nr:hypothetical protein [Paenibacillus sp. FSL R7-0273]AIQ46472.1 hypothetical protein R70723_11775 [Paenibacillus sp. FSL R7-0273]OMF97764.1 hypothetical protein BK144_03810 [Paenibacillus sp. FSL R7-0273]
MHRKEEAKKRLFEQIDRSMFFSIPGVVHSIKGNRQISRFLFTPGTRFFLADADYIVLKINSKDIEVVNCSNAIVETLSHDKLFKDWSAGTSIVKQGDLPLQVLLGVYEFVGYKKQITMKMALKYGILQPIIDGQIEPVAYKDYVNALPEELRKVISVTTIYQWKRRWDRAQDKKNLIKRDDIKNIREKITWTELTQLFHECLVQLGKEEGDKLNALHYLELKRKLREFRSQN